MPDTFEEVIEVEASASGRCAALRAFSSDVFAFASTAEAVDLLYAEGASLQAGATIAAIARFGAEAIAVREAVRAQVALTPMLTVADVVAVTARLRDSLRLAQVTSVREQILAQALAEVIDAFEIIVQIRATGLATGTALRQLSVTERILVRDAVLSFFGADAQGLVSMSVALDALTLRNWAVTETITAATTVLPQLVFRLSATGAARIEPSHLLQLLYSQEILEEFEVEGLLATPAGVTTWALNTRTGAVTEYSGYDFNSFTEIGGRYYGASSDGLFNLQADDDAGSPIVAAIRGGAVQFNGPRLAGMRAIYLGINGEGQFFLRLQAGSGEEYIYQVNARPMDTTKVWIGKGLRHRYMTYELVSTGQDFDLDTVEFVPMTPRRRV